MSIATYQAKDPAAGNELYTTLRDRIYRPDGTRRPIVYFPGGAGNNRSFLDSPSAGSQIAPALSDVGYPIISADLGGGGQWGNDLSQTRIGQAWTLVKTALGTKTDKFIGIGVSQGANALLNYYRGNPSNVAAIISIVGALPADAIHDGDRTGLQAQINAAYGSSAAWEAAKATHDPSLNASGHAGLPIRLYYATDDPVSTEAEQLAFKAGVGASCSSVSLGAVGHSGETIDVSGVLDFLEPYAR